MATENTKNDNPITEESTADAAASVPEAETVKPESEIEAYDVKAVKSDSSVEKAPKASVSKLAIAVIVALVAVLMTTVILLIVMLGGSSTGYSAEDIGLYNAVSAEKDAVTVDISGLFTDGFSIDLRSRGKCKINLNGELISGKWSCVDNKLTVSGGGVVYTGYISDGVILLENLMNEGISLTLKSDAVSAELLTERAGKYYITAFTVNQQVYEGSMLDTAGFGNWYIELDESGSGKALMFSTEETALVWSNDSISCTSGIILPYSYDDGTISLDYAGMSAVTFKNDDALDPFTEEGLSGTLKTDALETGSLWSGTLTISAHEGEGTLKDGSIPVYGFLCKDSSGRDFFEIYESSIRSGTPIISYWVEIKDGSLVPVIGEFDGWIYDYWLNTNDASALEMRLSDSALSLLYMYNWQEETCNMNLELAYAGKAE